MHIQTTEMNKALVPMLYRLMHATSHYEIDGYPVGTVDFCNKFNCKYGMPDMVQLIVDGLNIRDEYSAYADKMNGGK